MGSYIQYVGLSLAFFLVLVLYILWNDRSLRITPSTALFFGPKRYTPEDVRATAERLANSTPLEDKEVLPPKTGRRYIIVGGVRPSFFWLQTFY